MKNIDLPNGIMAKVVSSGCIEELNALGRVEVMTNSWLTVDGAFSLHYASKSGKIYAKQELLGVKVTYDDGDTSFTRFNGSPEEAEEYYLGTPFNFGFYNGCELIKTCTAIETYA